MALSLSTVGATAIAGGLLTEAAAATMALHFGSGNYDSSARAGTIANGEDVMAALAGSPTLAGARTNSGAEVQWAFQDTDLPRDYDYAEVVFVATRGGVATPVYLDSAPVSGADLGSKSANTIRQWVLRVEVATGAITVYETRITVPGGTEASPGVLAIASNDESDAEEENAINTKAVTPSKWWRMFTGARIVSRLAALADDARLSYNSLKDAPSFSEYAPLADPVFTGDPRAPTPSRGDNDLSIATTAFVYGELLDLRNAFNYQPKDNFQLGQTSASALGMAIVGDQIWLIDTAAAGADTLDRYNRLTGAFLGAGLLDSANAGGFGLDYDNGEVLSIDATDRAIYRYSDDVPPVLQSTVTLSGGRAGTYQSIAVVGGEYWLGHGSGGIDVFNSSGVFQRTLASTNVYRGMTERNGIPFGALISSVVQLNPTTAAVEQTLPINIGNLNSIAYSSGLLYVWSSGDRRVRSFYVFT